MPSRPDAKKTDSAPLTPFDKIRGRAQRRANKEGRAVRIFARTTRPPEFRYILRSDPKRRLPKGEEVLIAVVKPRRSA